MKSDKMFWKKDKRELKMKIKLKHKRKNNKLATLTSLKQNKKLAQVQSQNQQQPEVKRYNNKEFIEYRTKTLSNAIEGTANATSIGVFREQISNLRELSVMYGVKNYFNIQHDIVLLGRIIDFAESSEPLLDSKYTNQVWHIIAELYHLKTMISNQHIYNKIEAKQEANEIMQYTNENLI